MLLKGRYHCFNSQDNLDYAAVTNNSKFQWLKTIVFFPHSCNMHIMNLQKVLYNVVTQGSRNPEISPPDMLP